MEDGGGGNGNLKFLFWNIGGLKSRVFDEDWRVFMGEMDIVGFAETWIRERGDIPELKGMEVLAFQPAVKKAGVKLGRASGGMVVYVKGELKGEVSWCNGGERAVIVVNVKKWGGHVIVVYNCLLYTSDAADD